jgi:hypothetical protein
LREELEREKEMAREHKRSNDLVIELEAKGAIGFDDEGKCIYNEGQFIPENEA